MRREEKGKQEERRWMVGMKWTEKEGKKEGRKRMKECEEKEKCEVMQEGITRYTTLNNTLYSSTTDCSTKTYRCVDFYEIIENKRLGKGSYGSVYLCKHRKTGDEFACKVSNRVLRSCVCCGTV
jgi:hypothetical protein